VQIFVTINYVWRWHASNFVIPHALLSLS